MLLHVAFVSAVIIPLVSSIALEVSFHVRAMGPAIMPPALVKNDNIGGPKRPNPHPTAEATTRPIPIDIPPANRVIVVCAHIDHYLFSGRRYHNRRLRVTDQPHFTGTSGQRETRGKKQGQKPKPENSLLHCFPLARSDFLP